MFRKNPIPRSFTLLSWFVGVCVLLGIGGCKTEPPNFTSNEVVFFIQGKVNNQDIDLGAGDDNQYMLPFFRSDSLSIREFGGHLGNLECVGSSSCPGSFQFLFREIAPEGNAHQPVEKTIYPRDVEARGPATYLFQSYKASFFSASLPTGLKHTYNFGDGNYSMDPNPVHYYLNEGDSVVTPSLIVENTGTGCQSTVSYPISFLSGCEVDFFPVYVTSQISLNPSPSIGRSELWSYNGGPYQPFTVIGPPTDSITTVCLKSTDLTTYCVAEKCKNVIIDTAVVTCASNFDVIKETVLMKDVRDFEEVTVIWEDENGKVYRSDRFEQPGSSEFTIIDSEDYKQVEDNVYSKKVTISCSLLLFGDSETEFVTFATSKSVIAIAYPEI